MKHYSSFFLAFFLSILSTLSTQCFFGTLGIELTLSEDNQASWNFQITPKNRGDYTQSSSKEALTDLALFTVTNKIGKKLTEEDITKIELQILDLEIEQQKMIYEHNEKARLEEYNRKRREVELYLNRKNT